MPATTTLVRPTHALSFMRLYTLQSAMLLLAIAIASILFGVTILLSGDVELNPGPPKYPCGECGKACTSYKGAKASILCDTCNTWLAGSMQSVSTCLIPYSAYWVVLTFHGNVAAAVYQTSHLGCLMLRLTVPTTQTVSAPVHHRLNQYCQTEGLQLLHPHQPDIIPLGVCRQNCAY